ncbi:hypothetical protein KIN20_027015 [Parelaphostrongylus tenuis]|uniref:FH2 domain-containing protein n=1 Tax=Parelaphostrongylus tenuis TaxID=148309 RepID=A0AAD5QYV3_PARTN|nr:hypothetical protein KIN20_027015 [Parelaphostrongylus tenuis]
MDLVTKLESNDMDAVSTDLLSSLLKYFPTEEETLMIKNVRREEVVRNCDVLCWEAARRPTLKLRMELAIAREHIVQDLARYLDSTKRIRAACNTMRSSLFIHLLYKCLQYGNYLNQGTANANVVGFLLPSLPSVLTAKGKINNAENDRIVDLLVQHMEFDNAVLQDAINSLQSAKSIMLDEIEAASKELRSSVSRLQQHLITKGGGDVSLLEAYQASLKDAETSNSKLTSELQDIREIEASLQSYFWVKSVKLESMISIALEAFTTVSDCLKMRTTVKLRCSGETAGRERLTTRRRCLQTKSLTVEEMRKMFLQAANQ